MRDFWETILDTSQKPYIVAEIGSNFCKSFEVAKLSINLAAKSGADSVKFQTFKASEFVADKSSELEFYNNFGKLIRAKQYDLFKGLELPEDWHKDLSKIAEENKVSFSSSAADIESLEVIQATNPPYIKLSSEDLINPKILNACKFIKEPLVISTGMANEDEIDKALSILTENEKRNILICHCVSNYPVRNDDANLSRITALREKYNYPIGYSDHTLDSHSSTIAVALGARFIEKHFTISKKLEGPDHSMSNEPNEFQEMVLAIEKTFASMGQYHPFGNKSKIEYTPSEENYRVNYRRYCVAKTDLDEGYLIKDNDIDYKRVNKIGIHPFESHEIIGRVLKKSIKKNEIFETYFL